MAQLEMNKVFCIRSVPNHPAENFPCRKIGTSFVGVKVWNRPRQISMSQKHFTVRSVLKTADTIGRRENETDFADRATVLAIGAAVPPNYIHQSDYPDYYFRVTNSEHLSELKEKFQRICAGTKIRKRHFCLTEEMIQHHPSIAAYKEYSLNARNSLISKAVPELGKAAAEKALQEWGQPRSKITHLIFHSGTASVDMPGPDHKMIDLLGLNPTVNRIMLYYNGCFAGAAVLRVAKDIVENNPNARVLAICAESTVSKFRGPSETSMSNLVAQALFSDAASAVIIGANPDMSVEQPLFNIISAKQTTCPGTEGAISIRVTEEGLSVSLSPHVATHIVDSIKQCTSEVLAPLGISDMNSLFWIVHPGGRKILDGIESALGLDSDKLLASRHVLAEYGNEESASLFHVMDEMRRRSKEEGRATTGQGSEFGLAIGLGPGLTLETLVLRALANPINYNYN